MCIDTLNRPRESRASSLTLTISLSAIAMSRAGRLGERDAYATSRSAMQIRLRDRFNERSSARATPALRKQEKPRLCNQTTVSRRELPRREYTGWLEKSRF